MKKFFASALSALMLCGVVLTGCNDDSDTNNNVNNNTVATQEATTIEATYPGVSGKVDKGLLDENNFYEIYSPDDVSKQYPIESFQCSDDGTIEEGDIYEYDQNYNVIKQTHYVGELLDYTEVREYDSSNNNTRIVSYAGVVDRKNLVSTQVMEYDQNGNEIGSKTYDSENVLCYSDTTEYVEVDGMPMIKVSKSYDAKGNLTETHEYSYRSDGSTSKDIRTVYDEKGKVDYYYQTSYDAEGIAIAYDYFDKDGNKIDTPAREKEMYGE